MRRVGRQAQDDRTAHAGVSPDIQAEVTSQVRAPSNARPS